uniref:Uncharacterized protein n=1 Tax=Vespula pensylvanica TaxID=30213 RepID=A0A834PCW6_VESPE|nr:hypothetical protein H0235_003809 [Vespula pensylvanica]
MCDSRNRGRRKKEERYAGEVEEKEEVQGIEEEEKRPRAASLLVNNFARNVYRAMECGLYRKSSSSVLASNISLEVPIQYRMESHLFLRVVRVQEIDGFSTAMNRNEGKITVRSKKPTNTRVVDGSLTSILLLRNIAKPSIK